MKRRAQHRIRSFATVLAFLVAGHYATPVRAQELPPAGLNIVVIEGEGLVNNARQHQVHEPIVRVEDQAHKPVTGASVVFTLPTDGTTGTFSNGSQTFIATTDSNGVAVGKGMRLNLVTGKLVIHVTASYRGLSSRTSINQINEGVTGAKASSGGGHGKLVVVLAVVAAAAGGGAYYATHRGTSSSSPSSPTQPTVTAIGITAGSSTIIGPP